MKTYVLDTNVLLYSAQALESFEDNRVVIPMAVIEELDKFKKHQDELGAMRGRLSGGLMICGKRAVCSMESRSITGTENRRVCFR